jgi:lysophospholipase L1-like esterase
MMPGKQGLVNRVGLYVIVTVVTKFFRSILRAGAFAAVGIGIVFSMPGTPGTSMDQSGISRPIPTDGGDARYLQKSEEGIWNLISFPLRTPIQPTSTPLQLDVAFRSLNLFVDGRGRSWLAGEAGYAGGKIRIGRLENHTLVEAVDIGFPGGGNSQADLCFPSPGTPWIAWHHKLGPLDEIIVQDISGRRRWRITPLGSSALSGPRVLSDGRGGIWIFWAGKERGGYVVAGRRFDGRSWSTEVRIAENGSRPCLQPEAILGRDGIIRMAWSAYDGSDYEIFAVENRNGRWSKPRPLTDDPATDEHPRIIDLGPFSTAVAWARTDIVGTRLFASILSPDQPAAPVVVSGPVDTPDFEAIGTDRELILILEQKENLRWGQIETAALEAAARFEPRQGERSIIIDKSDPEVLFNPQFDETKYIAFGDSITYGELDGVSDPTVGYVPLLNTKLDAVFGLTNVINAGVPGETTYGGLARINSVLSTFRGRYILVMEGTNDVKAIEKPLETSIYNLREICRRCLLAGALPVLATVIPRRDWVWYFPEYSSRHNDLNSAIRQIAADLAIPLVEMETAFLSYPGGPEILLQPDGKHPNLMGYQVIADTWYSTIRKIPFPPQNIQVQAKYDKVSLVRKAGNLVSWRASPKTADPATVKGYRIYRRKPGEGPEMFRLLGTVTAFYAFIDTAIEAEAPYEYVVATLGTNGVEGPGSELVRIH